MVPWEERVARLEAEAAALARAGDFASAAAALNAAGLAALDGGLLPRAGELFGRVAQTFAAADRPFDEAAALANLALLDMRVGALPEAETRFRQALTKLDQASTRAGDAPDERDRDLREANVRVNLGVLFRRRNELAAAAAEYHRAQELYRRHDEHADVLDVETNLAVLDERADRLGQARQRLTWVREQLPPGTDDRARARAATTLAAVAAQQGQFPEAARLLEEAHATYLRLGLPRELAEVITNQGYVHLHTGNLVLARRHLEQAEWLFGRMGMRLDRARVLGGLGSLELRLGHTREAVERYAVALHVYHDGELAREVAATLVNLGVAHAADRDWASAVELQRAALEVYAAIGSPGDGTAPAEHNLGVALAHQGDHEAAGRHYARARAAYRRMGRAREVAEVDMNLGSLTAARGDIAGARRRYRQAARELRRLGLWLPLVRCVHNAGLTWPRHSSTRRTRVLPAWLAMDSLRFTLPSPDERARWRDMVGQLTAAAFDAADADPLLLAEVIERARGIGSIDAIDPAPPAPVTGLVDAPTASAMNAWNVPVRPPSPVSCGWPPTLTPYLARARSLTEVGGGPAAVAPRASVSLVPLMLAGTSRPEVP